MSVTRHTDVRAFERAAAPMAARSVSTATIIGAWVDWFIGEPPPSDEDVYLATYSSAGAAGIALRRRHYAVRIEDSDNEAAVAFAADLATDWPQLQGVVGRLAPCEAFARTWREHTGRSHALRFRLRSHLLTDVNAVPTPAGRFRAATGPDTEWLIGAFSSFIVEAKLPDEPARATTIAPKSIARDEIRIWDDGRPAAFARWTAAGARAARVGPVWTDPSARGRGYATALVAALARELIGSGRRNVFLDTDLANPTSNAIYAHIGFRPLHDFYHFDFVAP